MVVLAFARVLRIPVDGVGRSLDRGAIEVGDLVGVWIKNHDIAILEVDHLVGVFEKRRHVAREVPLLVVEAKDERRAFPCGVDRFLAVDDRGDRVAPLERVDGPADRLFGVTSFLPVFVDEVWDDLRVGVAVELVALRPEFSLELVVVIDDTVVDDRDVTRRIRMRMGVFVGRRPVGAPSGVTDPHVSVRLSVQARFEAGHLT